MYNPGLHILCEFETSSTPLLEDEVACKRFFDEVISSLNLCKVGEVYHRFTPGGFTAVVCLTESHLSIHTWPEFGKATFDVFLSNHSRDNSDRCRMIASKTLEYFQADKTQNREVVR